MHLMPLRRKPLWKMSLGMENKPLPGHHALSNFPFLIVCVRLVISVVFPILIPVFSARVYAIRVLFPPFSGYWA